MWRQAVDLFNRERFFECHEVLEDLWRPLEAGPHKLFLQGLLQVGVGFHHLRQDNFRGAKNLLAAGIEKLERVAADPGYQAPVALPPLIAKSQTALETVCSLGPDRLKDFSGSLIPKL